jgi:hypothetical protein
MLRRVALVRTDSSEELSASLFVWLLPLDQSGLGGPTSSYATAGITFGVSGALNPHYHDKVGITSMGLTVDLPRYIRAGVKFSLSISPHTYFIISCLSTEIRILMSYLRIFL